MDINEIRKQIMELPVDDYIHIIKLAKQLEKKQEFINNKTIRIAVIGSYSLQYFVIVLRLFLLKYDIAAEIFEGEYNGINMAVLDNQSTLYKFNPNIIIILSCYRDIHDMPDLFSDKQTVNNFIKTQGQYYQDMWERISQIKDCYIFQSNIVVPIERELGNLEANIYNSKRNIYILLNLELIKRKLINVKIIDMEYIASSVGKENWFDYTLYFTSKIEYSLKYIGTVCDVFAQQISVLYGKVRKCLILDLDNTLWGGVVADEGSEKIKVGPNDAVGEAYLYFQRYILNLKNRGVILAVISKNDFWSAKEPFEINKNLLLKYDDFASFIANWDSKAKNIEIVSKELGIGTDSFVFFDDNPAERELIKMSHPEVMVIDVPENVADYTLALEHAHPFEWTNLTKEDIGRADTYKSNIERKHLAVQCKNYQEYLLALDMKANVCYLQKKDIERFTQLINKSNQFNVRTKKYSAAEIKNLMANEKYRLLAVNLEDRFSKFGIISCVILEKRENQCFIDTWVMSCRVLKRDVEKFVFKKIVNAAIQLDCEVIVGEYIESKKNTFVKNLFPELGLHRLQKTLDGREIYECNVGITLTEDIAIKETKNGKK